MRKEILLAIALLVGTTLSAQATPPLENCKEKTGLPDKVDCLQRTVDTLQRQISKLDNMVIEWSFAPGSCIASMGNNLVEVRGTCNDPNKNKFIIREFHP